MTRARLGPSEIEISRVIFGSMGHGDASDSERIRVVHAALDAGVSSIDTAPLYGFGEVERIVGRAIRGRRGRVELLSKVGLRWDDDHGAVLFHFSDAAGTRRAVRRDSRPASIRDDVEASLRRLGTDYLDLCQIHHPDEQVDLADSIATLEELVCEGKIRGIGVSNFTPPQLARAIAASGGRLASDQLEYNLLKRGPERDIFPLAREHGVALLAYSPLDAGSLAGRLLQSNAIQDGRGRRASFRPANARAINAALLEGLEPVARAHDVSLAQVSLAWLLHQPDLTGVIAGARCPDQVRDNARAAEIVLREDELNAIGSRFARLRIDPAAGFPWRARARRLLARARRKLTRGRRS